MKMTEIYDVTDADTEAVQSPTERETNKQLEFEHDWAAEFIADSGEFVPQYVLHCHSTLVLVNLILPTYLTH